MRRAFPFVWVPILSLSTASHRLLAGTPCLARWPCFGPPCARDPLRPVAPSVPTAPAQRLPCFSLRPKASHPSRRLSPASLPRVSPLRLCHNITSPSTPGAAAWSSLLLLTPRVWCHLPSLVSSEPTGGAGSSPRASHCTRVWVAPHTLQPHGEKDPADPKAVLAPWSWPKEESEMDGDDSVLSCILSSGGDAASEALAGLAHLGRASPPHARSDGVRLRQRPQRPRS